ncbi:MAG: hypothetical protein EAZ74_02470 [Alphaproteobacteria bacterium]|nr:MAG: hypothetical protein EAY76_05000 [Alphaproteobacteria bacterium]TAF15118.1 MAG: hypothetical protein EAZ74_02470 [Alphaproteobacteria bacterium]TAF76691.1 MAG: hypothetical protein EAZ52_02765 [Alphaproteobacteria bacterium]
MNNEDATQERKPIGHLYVSVDTCAELGGQPYRVLEALRDVYALTNRRTLTVVETAQGLLEKTEFTSPEMLEVFPHSTRKFSEFARNNPDMVQIIETENCKRFRDTLEEIIFPEMVDRLVDVAEAAMIKMQEHVWAHLQQQDSTNLMGREIGCADDVPICIEYGAAHPNQRERPLVFVPKEVNDAAKIVFPMWKAEMQKDPSLSRATKRDLQKNDMAVLMRAVQEAKACTHTILAKLEPELAEAMGEMPAPILAHYEEEGSIRLEMLREHAHLYHTMAFPDADSLGELESTVQAVRFTTLWPWTHKKMLHESAAGRLDAEHHNAADRSYLNLFTAHLPDMSPPADTLYVLLSHDMPLRRQFLEVTTGVAEYLPGKKGTKETTYGASAIYRQEHIQDRPLEEYPHEAILVGAEFVELMYKEIVASLAPYITKEERNTLTSIIRANHPKHSTNVAAALHHVMDGASTLPDSLHAALTVLTDEINDLETYVARDIQAFGEMDKRGNYQKQKATRLAQGYER